MISIQTEISDHFSNWYPLTSLSQISVLFKYSDLWLIYWLGLGFGLSSVTSLDVDLRKREMAIDFRIERRFENLKKGHRSEVQMSVM